MEPKEVFTGERLICVGCGGYINSTHADIMYKDEKKTKPQCPDCGLPLLKMCRKDRECHCALTIHSGIAHCPDCNKPVCPECGSHDIAQISRVTGYLQDVKGWNRSKQQELLDRHRVDITNGIST